MNLRTLKKLSKRAAPLLPLLGDTRPQFRADKEGGEVPIVIKARKHFERMRSPHSENGRQGGLAWPARDGRGYVKAWPPTSPRKGTIMVGGMSAGEEPEWSDEPAWCALTDLVFWHFTDIDGSGEMTHTRICRTPSEVFRAAREIIADQQASAA